MKITDASGQSAGTAFVSEWRPRRVHLQIQAPADATLHINHFDYVGWKAHIEGTQRWLSVGHDDDGLLKIAVPAGTYSVVLLLERQLPERLGIAITLCSLVLLVVLALIGAAGRSPSFLKYGDPSPPAHQSAAPEKKAA